jgi:hypothetical protein
LKTKAGAALGSGESSPLGAPNRVLAATLRKYRAEPFGARHPTVANRL